MRSIEPKVTNKEAARQLGVGLNTITALRRMLGIGPAARKVFASELEKFLRRYQDFIIADAASIDSMLAFQRRHPDYKLPPTINEEIAA